MAKGETIRSYNLPVGAHIMIDDGEKDRRIGKDFSEDSS